MPIAGLGLHVVIALICAVHAVRTRQTHYWLFVLFAFPLLGSVVYFFAIYLPNSRLERQALRTVSVAVKVLDPSKDVRMARQEYEHTPTAQNQLRLAEVLLQVNEAQEAALLFESALQGPFSSQPDIRLQAARARLECQDFARALAHIRELMSTHPQYHPDTAQILYARALAGTNDSSQTRMAFEQAIQRFGTFEAYAEYQIWALAQGEAETVARIQVEIDKITRRWTAMTRELNITTLNRLKAAQKQARNS